MDDTLDMTLLARYLRLAVVRQQFEEGNLSQASAEELLSGCLTPGDETTRFDDREFLTAPLDVVEQHFHQ